MYNENKKAYNKKYSAENFKRIPLDVRKDFYEMIQKHTSRRNESINGFIKRAIIECIERDNSDISDTSGENK